MAKRLPGPLETMAFAGTRSVTECFLHEREARGHWLHRLSSSRGPRQWADESIRVLAARCLCVPNACLSSSARHDWVAAMADKTTFKNVHPKTRSEWRRWLQRNHANAKGAWLITYKKATGKPRVEYADAVEEALCFGWVDSHSKTIDEERSMLMFTPRNPKSAWSRPNKERIERLTKDGQMTEAGSRAVTAAKANGSWNALDSVEALIVPADLEKALGRNKRAKEHFDAFPPSAKKTILWWIESAKRDETRQRRIAETVRLAAQNVRANQ